MVYLALTGVPDSAATPHPSCPDGIHLKPEGLQYDSPGQRPGWAGQRRRLALKGRDKPRGPNGLWRPYRASRFRRHPAPRALPWAAVYEPFRLEANRPGYQSFASMPTQEAQAASAIGTGQSQPATKRGVAIMETHEIIRLVRGERDRFRSSPEAGGCAHIALLGPPKIMKWRTYHVAGVYCLWFWGVVRSSEVAAERRLELVQRLHIRDGY